MYTHTTAVKQLFLYPAPIGALTQLYAGIAPEAAGLNGQVRRPRSSLSRIARDADTPCLRARWVALIVFGAVGARGQGAGGGRGPGGGRAAVGVAGGTDRKTVNGTCLTPLIRTI